MTDSFGDVPVSSDSKAALARLAGDLRNLGSTVEYCPLTEFDFADAWATWGEIFQAEVGIVDATRSRGPVRRAVRR